MSYWQQLGRELWLVLRTLAVSAAVLAFAGVVTLGIVAIEPSVVRVWALVIGFPIAFVLFLAALIWWERR